MKKTAYLKRQAVAGIVASALMASCMTPAQAQTGLDSMLAGIYTAAGQPTYVQTNKMNTFSAGYVAVRTPINNFNVFAVVPPNFNAGCGGIDAYFGTFSFINSQQLEALIKAIGQDAIPFLFMMAIQSMCHTCYDILTWMQNMAQKMNSTTLNACQITRGIFTTPQSTSGNADAASSLISRLSAAAGSVADWFQGFFGDGNPDHTANPETTSNQQIAAGAAAAGSATVPTITQVTAVGNSTWKGIVNNQVVSYLNPNNAQDPQTAELILSLIGAKVVQQGNGTGTPTTGTGSAGSTSTSGPGSYTVSGSVPPNVTLKDLVEGKPNHPYIQCQPTTIGATAYPATGPSGQLDPTACRLMQTGSNINFKSINYIGLDAQINCAIFGNTGDPNQTCPAGSGPGIVAEMQSGVSPTNWTPLEQKIYAQSPIPFVMLMQRVSMNPGMQTTIASYALPYIKANAAANLGIQLRNAIMQIFQNGGKETYLKPDGYEQTLQQLNADIQYYARQTDGAVTASVQLAQYVSNYLQSIHAYIPGQ